MRKTFQGKYKIVKPARLELGDTIGLIAPSGPIWRKKKMIRSIPEHLEKGLVYLDKMGFKYNLGKHFLKRRGYLAGHEKERLEDLHNMFQNKKVKAIFCLAGGYGTPRLLPEIDFDVILKNPKIFEGYSDITSLLTAFHQVTGLVTFHGPMANYDFGRKIQFNKENLWRAVTQTEPIGEIPHPPDGPDLVTLCPGYASGKIIGGNLSLLISTLGTPHEIDTTGSILFLEDVEEEPYRFDRMLNHLLLAGKLQSANGIIIGECIKCNPKPPDKPSLSLMDVLQDFIPPLKKPAFYGLCCGHGKKKVTLPLGVNATMDATHCRLYIEENAVV